MDITNSHLEFICPKGNQTISTDSNKLDSNYQICTSLVPVVLQDALFRMLVCWYDPTQHRILMDTSFS